MQAFVAGTVAGVVLLAAAVIVPYFLQSNVNEREAAFQAEAARRNLASFDPQLELAAHRLEGQTLGNEFKPDENRKWLADALKDAQQAVQTAAPVGVPEILASTRLTEGLNHYAAAELLRNRQRDVEAGLLAAVQEAAVRRGEFVRFSSLDTTAALETLAESRTGAVEARRDEQAARVGELEAEIGKRNAELDRIRGEIQQRRDALLQLEKNGFKLGNDSSFESYAAQYERVSNEIVELQRQDQLLTSGGLAGAELDPYDLLASEVNGGEAQVGIEELQYELAAALCETLERLQSAINTTDASAQQAESLGQTAQQQANALKQMLEQSNQVAKAELAKLKELNTATGEKELAAISALTSAVDALGRSVTAANQFVKKARDEKNAYDPQGLNPRLKTITSDPTFVQSAETAKAAMNEVLAPRIYIERAKRLARIESVLTQATGVVGGSEMNVEEIRTALQEAQTAATDALTSAREALTPLAEAQGSLSWIHSGTLATVHWMLSQVSGDASASQREQALDALLKSLDNVQRSPYAQDLVRFRDHLRATAGS